MLIGQASVIFSELSVHITYFSNRCCCIVCYLLVIEICELLYTNLLLDMCIANIFP